MYDAMWCFVSSDILNELLQRENRVLHFWTMRKRRLDQCQQYVVFERSTKQVSACVCCVWWAVCICVHVSHISLQTECMEISIELVT